MPYSANTSSSIQSKIRIENIRVVDVGVTAEETSLAAAAGFQADSCKAYLEFDICHSLPEVAGPVQAENFIGYTSDTLQVSHPTLLHQQFNIRHLIKAYAAEDDKIARDRIIGCVVATSYPKKPMGGWVAGQAVPIRAVATIFKLAEGVNKLLGDHLTSRVKQNVSIETTTAFGNIGIHRLSTGETWPILDLPANVAKCLSPYKGSVMPHVGKMGNEQLVVLYGTGAPIQFRGVGMTSNPAEHAARIVAVQAEKKELEAETLFIVTAERQTQEMIGMQIAFKSGRVGKIIEVVAEGLASIPGLPMRLEGKPENPVLKIRLPDSRLVLRRYTDVQGMLS
jgi:hypothetical protein